MSNNSNKRKVVKPSLFETRDLIRLVKERKCLWDRFDEDYRDRSMKDAAWLEICSIIEPDFEQFGEDMQNLIASQITKKWHNVRDSFVKSKKQGSKNKPYIYAKLLSFLEPVYLEDKDKADETDNGEQLLNEQVFFIDGESDAKRQKLDFDRSEREEKIMSMLANLLNREEDEDRAFFTSITPAVKKLTEDSKMEFRIEVMNLLKALQSKERNLILLSDIKVDRDEESQSD